MAEIDGLLKLVTERGASDLHIKVGSPPVLRLHSRLVVVAEIPPLTAEQTRLLAYGIMDEHQRETLESGAEVDFAYQLDTVGRFRVNAFKQRGMVGMALRRVATERSSIEALGLPPVILRLADEPRGLVLVTGTAGSGKTTTLASMVDHINSTREGHIVTIEDPIEVMHEDKRCIVNQREIGIDTASYAEALRHVVRQDPDVILIGEMRDFDTVSAALTAAEIGNLVFSTLHTIDATETINRIIDFFPPHQQQQVRLMLGATLKGIVSLRLIPSIQGGLVPAVEVLVMTGTVREYIIDPDKTSLIRDAMEEGMYYGMQTFDQSLLRLYQDGKITLDDAISMAHNAHDFKIKVRQLGLDTSTLHETGIY
jgi:twitching motility protein PilT